MEPSTKFSLVPDGAHAPGARAHIPVAPVTVVIAADSVLFGDGLAALIATRPSVKVVGRAHHHTELADAVDAAEPDAVIITLRALALDTVPTIAAARQLRARHPCTGLVVVADRANFFALELLREGASRTAYLLDERIRGIDAMLIALYDVCAGQTVVDPSVIDSLIARRDGAAAADLSAREIDVLEQLTHGLSNRAIADVLCLSTKAVEKYVSTIFRKLELTDQFNIDRRVTAAVTYLHTQKARPALLPPIRVDYWASRPQAPASHEKARSE